MPEDEVFITVKLHGQGAVRRSIGTGKTPKTFTGYRVSAGQFIYSRIDARNGAFAIVPQELDGSVVSKDFPVFDIDNSLCNPKFLEHFLKTRILAEMARSRSSGATNRQRIKEDILLDFPIPLPPLDEQRLTARTLDGLDNCEGLISNKISLFSELRQSLFHSYFGDPTGNELGFPKERLGDLSVKFSDGPFGSNLKSSDYRSSGVRVVRLQNIGIGKFLNTDQVFIEKEHFSRLEKHEVIPGDIIVGTLGDPVLRSCIVPIDLKQSINKADCVQIRVNPAVATNSWLSQLLNMPGTLSLAQGLAKGQTRSRISMGRLRNLEVPCPPLELQRSFESALMILATEEELAASQLKLAGEFRESLQSRAFQGEP